MIYVWIDALSNYSTALNWGTDHDDLYKTFWPAQVHLVGKEIMRFHTIYWPIMLHALGLPLPQQVFGHGWLVIDAASPAKAEVFLEQLRKSAEGFPAALLKTPSSPSAAMTGWIADGEAPSGFSIDQDIELRSAENAVIRYARHSLEG